MVSPESALKHKGYRQLWRLVMILPSTQLYTWWFRPQVCKRKTFIRSNTYVTIVLFHEFDIPYDGQLALSRISRLQEASYRSEILSDSELWLYLSCWHPFHISLRPQTKPNASGCPRGFRILGSQSPKLRAVTSDWYKSR